MNTEIKAEQLFSIIPIDEQLIENPIDLALKQKKEELDAIETRKPKDYYENLREREG